MKQLQIDPILTPFIERQGLVVLDGGLATELEARGFDLRDNLWSARLLPENPQAIRRLHLDYLRAGADCIISASYQASFPGFMARGYSRQEAAELMLLSVNLAMEARDQFWQEAQQQEAPRLRPLVAASIGPYGAYLANGSEYTGNYALDAAALIEWHRPRWDLLAGSGADILACETIPAAAEAQALAALLRERPFPAWVSFSCRDGAHLHDGTPLAQVIPMLNQLPALVALGVNCTPPRFMPAIITLIQELSPKPVIVYPNSGERYDPLRGGWHGEADPATFGTMSREWRKLGAALLGGCCRTGPAHIQQIRDRLPRHRSRSK